MYKKIFYVLFVFCFAVVGCEKAEMVYPIQSNPEEFIQNDQSIESRIGEPPFCLHCVETLPFVIGMGAQSNQNGDFVKFFFYDNCDYDQSNEPFLLSEPFQVNWSIYETNGGPNPVMNGYDIQWQIPITDFDTTIIYELKITAMYQIEIMGFPALTNKTLNYQFEVDPMDSKSPVKTAGSTETITCVNGGGSGTYLVIAP